MKTLILTLFLFAFHFSSVHSQEPKESTSIEMPYFQGCTAYEYGSSEKRMCSNAALVAYISDNLVYPRTAVEKNIEGTVYVNFTVSAEGQLTDATVLNSLGGGCDEEAIRVINSMTGWEPSQKDGIPIDMELNLPILFSLNTLPEGYSEVHTIFWGKLNQEKVSVSNFYKQIEEPIVVRDEYGNAMDISNLSLAYKRGRTFSEQESTGKITAGMKRLISKMKAGGELLITATVLDDGEFVEVARLYQLVE